MAAMPETLVAARAEHARSEASVAAVYAEHGPFVWRVLRHIGVRPADLDDALQEVFVVVHRKLASFDRASSIRTWLFAIATMVAMSFRKRAHVRRETVVERVPEREDTSAGPDTHAERARALARALELVQALPDDLRLVFVLYEIEEMPMKEVAAALEVPLQTAYTRLHRARELFEARAALAREG